MISTHRDIPHLALLFNYQNYVGSKYFGNRWNTDLVAIVVLRVFLAFYVVCLMNGEIIDFKAILQGAKRNEVNLKGKSRGDVLGRGVCVRDLTNTYLYNYLVPNKVLTFHNNLNCVALYTK